MQSGPTSEREAWHTRQRPDPLIFARCEVELSGVVQGVGLRPAIYRLATKAGLSGSVQNRSGTVRIILEGPQRDIDNFVRLLPRALPPNAALEKIRIVSHIPIPLPDKAAHHFEIIASEPDERADVCVPPDLAICDACRAEVLDPMNRRFRHPFATCTNCGPRYTILSKMPYDRANTSMIAFEMCTACRAEYTDPNDRRFHAETIACPNCGPQLSFRKPNAAETNGTDALLAARAEIARGGILAVKGIGGFLLAVDPFNAYAVRRLRTRKRRPHKPFAIMVESAKVAEQWVIIADSARKLMESPRCPIVILPLRPTADQANGLPIDLISPDTPTVGVMLPSAPLLLLLLVQLPGDPTPPFQALIMTSGNRHDEPIAVTDEEGESLLRDIADAILTHDREILRRCDDSVCAIRGQTTQVWRRARGYAPEILHLAQPIRRSVLAMGAEIKNTIAFGYGSSVLISQHLGDLSSPEANDAMEKTAEGLLRLSEREPDCVAVDLHPDMHPTRYGERIASRLSVPLVKVQHHAAHAAAVLAEHGLSAGPALVFDGGGLGVDGSIWGAEMFLIEEHSWKRVASFSPVPLPGGDAAVRMPSRQLLARWVKSGITPSAEWLKKLNVPEDEYAAVASMSSSDACGVITHGAGRVFDAWAAGLCLVERSVTYEGQAAVRLESAAKKYSGEFRILPFHHYLQGEMLVVDWSEAFAWLHDNPPRTSDIPFLAASLHHAMSRAAIIMIEHALAIFHADYVGLTGGVFMNEILTQLVVSALRERNIKPLIHEKVPPNDGGLALGQVVVASATPDEEMRQCA